MSSPSMEETAPFNRAQEVRVVAAHHHVIRADHISHHRQRVRAERNGVVVQLLQIETR